MIVDNHHQTRQVYWGMKTDIVPYTQLDQPAVKRSLRTRFWDWVYPDPCVEDERRALAEIVNRIKLKNELQESRVRRKITENNLKRVAAENDIQDITGFLETINKLKNRDLNGEKLVATWRFPYKNKDGDRRLATMSLTRRKVHDHFFERKISVMAITNPLNGQTFDKRWNQEIFEKMIKKSRAYTGIMQPWLDGTIDDAELRAVAKKLDPKALTEKLDLQFPGELS
jgi:hypothetical protein